MLEGAPQGRTVVWTEHADRDLAQLAPRVQGRVVEGIELLALASQGDVRRLRGTGGGELALRVGDWRAWFVLDEGAGILTVLRVRHRGEAYRR